MVASHASRYLEPEAAFSLEVSWDLLQHVTDPLIVTAEDGCIVLVNAQAEAKYGYTERELIGQPVMLLFPRSLPAQRAGKVAAYPADPGPLKMGSGVHRARRKDGTEFPAELSLNSARLAGESVTVYLVRDLSEGQRADHELDGPRAPVATRETELRSLERQKDELVAMLSHILDGMSEAVVAVDPEARIVKINRAACVLFGGSSEDLLGCPAPEVFRWEDESGRRLERDEYSFAQAVARGTPRGITGRYFRKDDGSRIPVFISSAPVIDSERGIRMIVQVIRDVSREREAEELKDRIISLVSHELRTPIGHIKGFASSLLESDVEWDAATERDFIAEIDREADRLSALVTDLLDMSKIESGKDFLDRQPCALATIVEQALAAVSRVTARHRVINEVKKNLPAVLADGSQIERVVANLVENAAKYSEAGTEIRLHSDVSGEELLLCVADQGHGIPPEYGERIFERFFRIKSVRPRAPGTGLGLPICRGIVEAHGGRLWLETQESRGSRFWFSLPLHPRR